MSAKTYKIGEHEGDVRMHDDRLVIRIDTRDRKHSQEVYKDLVAKGVIVPVRLD